MIFTVGNKYKFEYWKKLCNHNAPSGCYAARIKT